MQLAAEQVPEPVVVLVPGLVLGLVVESEQVVEPEVPEVQVAQAVAVAAVPTPESRQIQADLGHKEPKACYRAAFL